MRPKIYPKKINCDMQLRNKINAIEFCEIIIPSDITDH